MKTIVFKSDIELSNTGNCNLYCLEFRLRITLAFLKRLFKGNLKMSSSETEMASSSSESDSSKLSEDDEYYSIPSAFEPYQFESLALPDKEQAATNIND